MHSKYAKFQVYILTESYLFKNSQLRHNDVIMMSRECAQLIFLTFDLIRAKFQVPTPTGSLYSENSSLGYDDVIMTSRECAQ